MAEPPGTTAAIVVNFNTAELTRRAVESLLAQSTPIRIVVVDNRSEDCDRDSLSSLTNRAELIESDVNLGFAGACNLAIARVLEDPSVSSVLLFNSDADASPGLVTAMRQRLDTSRSIDMVGATMLRDSPGGEIDSMGIAFYDSCLASNRVSEDEVLFGPTGGCALYSRRLLEDLMASHGHVFDTRFFCYAEDTDLAARALSLGYRPALCPEGLARHVGQASSGGGFSRFVLYHGIRNSIWVVAKNLPLFVICRRLHLIVAMHVGIFVRHLARGEGGTVLRLYVDALKGLPAMLVERQRIRKARRVTTREFLRYVTPRFYQHGTAREALRQLFRRDRADG